MRLVEYVQGVLTDAPLGGSRRRGLRRKPIPARPMTI